MQWTVTEIRPQTPAAPEAAGYKSFRLQIARDKSTFPAAKVGSLPYQVVRILTPALAPQFKTSTNKLLATTRLSKNTWAFEIPSPDKFGFVPEVKFTAENDSGAPITPDDVVFLEQRDLQSIVEYTAMDHFNDQYARVPMAPDGGTTNWRNLLRTEVIAARKVFLEIDLLFLFQKLIPYTLDPTLNTNTRDLVLQRFQHRYPNHDRSFAYILQCVTNNQIETLSGELGRQAQVRRVSWAKSEEPPPLNPDQLSIERKGLNHLAIAIGRIFISHFGEFWNQTQSHPTVRLAILAFASGHLRMGMERFADDERNLDVSLAFNAEPNSHQFTAFAEFGELVTQGLKTDLLKNGFDSIYRAWQFIQPALILGIETYADTFSPYPNPAHTKSTFATPAVLQRKLRSGQDPRPDRESINRLQKRIQYFAGENSKHVPEHSYYPIWGSVLQQLQRRRIDGALPDQTWQPYTPTS